MFCTNCGKKYRKGEQCSACRKPLGTTGFVCIKINDSSEHFCSKTCSQGKGVDASYQPKEAKCKKCRYIWMLPKEAKFPIACPQCRASYTPPQPQL